MTSPVFLDTSGAIALLHRGDVHHAKATQLAAGLMSQRRPRITTTAVLAELGDGFARKGRWSIASRFLSALLMDPLVTVATVDPELVSRACDLRNARTDKEWGLTDCLSFVVMADNGVDEAFTADHHFQQAGFRALLLQ
ncbi:MAG: PIN domain-containing protein [Planctomycetales bacterium]